MEPKAHALYCDLKYEPTMSGNVNYSSAMDMPWPWRGTLL